MVAPLRGHKKYRKTKPFRVGFQSAKRLVFARSMGVCEIDRAGVCTGRGQSVHHRLPIRHDMANDARFLAHACDACHKFLHRHENLTIAEAEGWLLDEPSVDQEWTPPFMLAIAEARSNRPW